MQTKTLLALAVLGSSVSAYSLPQKLKDLYNSHKSGNCKSTISGKMDSGTVYCADIPNAIIIKSNNGYDNMDVDCDGANNSAGKCSNDPSGQGETSFKDTVKGYGIPDLNANIHPYVVYGTSNFDPQSHGMKPLSVMAIVCNNQLHYGIWGDTNGFHSTGESSISLATLCFPNDGLTGDNGHDPKDVLYIGFTGQGAVPGKSGANWKASSAKQFEDSIKSLGDKLVAGLP